MPTIPKFSTDTLFSIPANKRNTLIALVAGAVVAADMRHMTDHVIAFRAGDKNWFGDATRSPSCQVEPLVNYCMFDKDPGMTYIVNKDLSELITDCKKVKAVKPFKFTLDSMELEATEGGIQVGCQLIKDADVKRIVVALEKWVDAVNDAESVTENIFTFKVTPANSNVFAIAAIAMGAKVARNRDEFEHGEGGRMIRGKLRYCGGNWNDSDTLIDLFVNEAGPFFCDKDVSDVIPSCKPLETVKVPAINIRVNGEYTIRNATDDAGKPAINFGGLEIANVAGVRKLIVAVRKYLAA